MGRGALSHSLHNAPGTSGSSSSAVPSPAGCSPRETLWGFFRASRDWSLLGSCILLCRGMDLCWLLGQVGVLQPRMLKKVFQGWSVCGVHGQTPPDEVLALCRETTGMAGQLLSVFSQIPQCPGHIRSAQSCIQSFPSILTARVERHRDTRATSSLAARAGPSCASCPLPTLFFLPSLEGASQP